MIRRGVSSEENDMERPYRADRIATAGEFPLRCVWTNHPDHEHNCESRIPARAVADAWRRELELGRGCAGFFHFAWRGHVWLPNGLPDCTGRGGDVPTLC